MKKTIYTIALVSFCTTLSVNAAEQTGQNFVQQFNACKAIKDHDDRLACFDQLEAPTSNLFSGTQELSPSSSKKPTQQEKEDAFGVQSIKKTEEVRKKEEEAELKKISSTIVEAGKNSTGQYFFILENGQVWRQLPADTGSVRLPKKLDGAKVEITRKMLGSFSLRVKGRSVRVSRLK
ncbi:hypothetical protein GCM10017044_00040 [Kordiimonas sediminis]|uniref:Uncharacterized protein n=1 Tax=Kordiimonas sediminis TaxID=1735581 RepID=A0A919AI31_9PROT|nr:hypothetical protein [Kordiimonas sediminis]GHF10352.1 hypothetical protein GCM10017044_00040 [Kordiimonas sediminis]